MLGNTENKMSLTTLWQDDLQPNWRVLLLAKHPTVSEVQVLANKVSKLVVIRGTAPHIQCDPMTLPFAQASFDAVLLHLTLHTLQVFEAALVECARILRPDGFIGLVDVLLPNHKKSERYVQALEQLRDPTFKRALPLYRWKEHLALNGFTLASWEQTSQLVPLLEPSHTLTGAQQQRLQVLLARAPGRVATWLQPALMNIQAAHYRQQLIVIRGKRSNG